MIRCSFLLRLNSNLIRKKVSFLSDKSYITRTHFLYSTVRTIPIFSADKKSGRRHFPTNRANKNLNVCGILYIVLVQYLYKFSDFSGRRKKVIISFVKNCSRLISFICKLKRRAGGIWEPMRVRPEPRIQASFLLMGILILP